MLFSHSNFCDSIEGKRIQWADVKQILKTFQAYIVFGPVLFSQTQGKHTYMEAEIAFVSYRYIHTLRKLLPCCNSDGICRAADRPSCFARWSGIWRRSSHVEQKIASWFTIFTQNAPRESARRKEKTKTHDLDVLLMTNVMQKMLVVDSMFLHRLHGRGIPPALIGL
jgi:hypothetical protein